jgi:hypothetical protein
MLTQRIRLGLLTTCLLALTILPVDIAAQDACGSTALASYDRAFIQAHGERFDDACANVCLSHLTDSMASYQRAFIQAHGERLLETACADGCLTDVADAMAAYDRATIQAQEHVMVESLYATCSVVA